MPKSKKLSVTKDKLAALFDASRKLSDAQVQFRTALGALPDEYTEAWKMATKRMYNIERAMDGIVATTAEKRAIKRLAAFAKGLKASGEERT